MTADDGRPRPGRGAWLGVLGGALLWALVALLAAAAVWLVATTTPAPGG